MTPPRLKSCKLAFSAIFYLDYAVSAAGDPVNLIASVSSDGQSYSGTYARFFYDVNGNFLFEDDGTLTAERLPERY
jgi:hypothetical protein